MNKKKVLILNGQYIPGFKGGGPIRSIYNLVEHLKNYIDFYVITADRDLNDKEPYNNIKSNSWNKVGGANVYYLSQNKETLSGFKKVINSINYDYIYLNGFFSHPYTLYPILLAKFNKISSKRIIVSPRGDFSPGHLRLKTFKKNTYIKLMKVLNMFDNVTWHCASLLEVQHVKNIFSNNNVVYASNLSTYVDKNSINFIEKNKIKGTVDLIFVSRIAEKKNLLYALNILKKSKGNINFDIYGPIYDIDYWEKCKEEIKKMPKNIKIEYKGELVHDEINEIMQKYHALFFPTLGENFGHVIVEALLASNLLLISDTTPWRDLYNKNVGWDLSLSSPEDFNIAIDKLLEMDNKTYSYLSKQAFEYVFEFCNNNECIEENLKIFI